jgi:hypothetical protein
MSRHQFQVTLLQAYFQVNFNTILTYLPKRIICVDTNARRESEVVLCIVCGDNVCAWSIWSLVLEHDLQVLRLAISQHF